MNLIINFFQKNKIKYILLATILNSEQNKAMEIKNNSEIVNLKEISTDQQLLNIQKRWQKNLMILMILLMN